MRQFENHGSEYLSPLKFQQYYYGAWTNLIPEANYPPERNKNHERWGSVRRFPARRSLLWRSSPCIALCEFPRPFKNFGGDEGSHGRLKPLMLLDMLSISCLAISYSAYPVIGETRVSDMHWGSIQRRRNATITESGGRKIGCAELRLRAAGDFHKAGLFFVSTGVCESKKRYTCRREKTSVGIDGKIRRQLRCMYIVLFCR